MFQSRPDALPVSRSVLRLLIKLNILLAFLILALLIGSLVAEGWFMTALGVGPAGNNSKVFFGMRLIMVIGIAAVPVTHIVLTRLLAIVETVGVGDPFVSENAERLETIAWSVLGLELLHLAVGAISAGINAAGQKLDIDWNFSVTRWLAVLLCFVLARVFETGARMREDLEGTV
jgi:hypothetical protein